MASLPATTRNTNALLSLLTLLALFSHPATALSVSQQAAIGIGVGVGFLLAASLAAVIYLKFGRKRRAERQAFRDQNPEPSREDAIRMHALEGQKGFNIWGYDHKAWMANREAKKNETSRGPVEEVA